MAFSPSFGCCHCINWHIRRIGLAPGVGVGVTFRSRGGVGWESAHRSILDVIELSTIQNIWSVAEMISCIGPSHLYR